MSGSKLEERSQYVAENKGIVEDFNMPLMLSGINPVPGGAEGVRQPT
jgi:hypothetical protein